MWCEMFPEAFLPEANLKIVAVETDPAASTIEVSVRNRELGAVCPYCGAYSKRVHSHYERRIKDLPCSGYGVTILLEVRRFFCKAGKCARKTFSERLPEVSEPYARQTTRLRKVVQTLALLVGSSMGTRLLGLFQVPTSIWSVLRLLRKIALPTRPTPRILGVDDWAIRRGHRYGTLLINLETAEGVDLLADRETQTFAAWLRSHPGVEVISRDRAEAYADGARLGAPQALQVADRWHLLKNLGDRLAAVLPHHQRELKTLVPSVARFPTVPSPNQSPKTSPQTQPEAKPNSRRSARFVEVHELRQQGFTLSAIARQMRMDRKTVRKYLHLTTLPAHRPQQHRPSQLLPYQPYLLEHWQQGRRSLRQLWHDIQALGYTGCFSVVATFMSHVRKQQGLPPFVRTDPQCPLAPPLLSPRRAAWLLLARPDQLTSPQLLLRFALPDLHPDIHLAATLAQRFAQIVRDRLPDALDTWLQHSLHASLSDIRAFARGIQRDYAAVKAALALPWSNGMVEGQVNRLKFIKRQMFGRAKFDLLRLRVLA